jgi:hypothetical protein
MDLPTVSEVKPRPKEGQEVERDEEEDEGEEGDDQFSISTSIPDIAGHQAAMGTAPDPAVRRGSVSTANASATFKVEQTRRALRKASVSGDMHEMQAALAAASALGNQSGLNNSDAMELATASQEVRETIRGQGAEAEMRAKLHDSAAIDAMVARFWQLLQLESQELFDGSSARGATQANGPPPAPPRARAPGKLQKGFVTREAYCEFHIRINKTISSGAFTVESALTDAQKDWTDDVARFADDAQIKAARARPGRSSGLSVLRHVLRSKSAFHGAFGWARSALNSQQRRVPARAVAENRLRAFPAERRREREHPRLGRAVSDLRHGRRGRGLLAQGRRGGPPADPPRPGDAMGFHTHLPLNLHAI